MFFSLAFQARFRMCHVLVAKTKRCITKLGQRGFGGNSVCLSLDHMTKALAAYTSITLATYGDTVWRLTGLAIGGVLGRCAGAKGPQRFQGQCSTPLCGPFGAKNRKSELWVPWILGAVEN